MGWFPFGRALCKRRRSQRFSGSDLYHITVFFPGLLTDTISWGCSSLGKVNSGKSRCLLKIQSLGKQNHGDCLLVLDIRSVLSAASFSASPSAGQGLGKEWERKSIRCDKREVCKSCWSSLQRQEPQELCQEQPSHLVGSEVKGSAAHWPGYPDPCLGLSHLPTSRPQQTACSSC